VPERVLTLRSMTRARPARWGRIGTEVLGVRSDQRQSGGVIDALRMCAGASHLLRMAMRAKLVARKSPKMPTTWCSGADGALRRGWRDAEPR
jgi:hypothetical protein